MAHYRIGLPIGIGVLVFGQAVVPDASPYLQGGGLLILGAVCWKMLATMDKMADALNALRVHCAAKSGEPTPREREQARVEAA